jgi:hypothetical protein
VLLEQRKRREVWRCAITRNANDYAVASNKSRDKCSVAFVKRVIEGS